MYTGSLLYNGLLYSVLMWRQESRDERRDMGLVLDLFRLKLDLLEPTVLAVGICVINKNSRYLNISSQKCVILQKE